MRDSSNSKNDAVDGIDQVDSSAVFKDCPDDLLQTILQQLLLGLLSLLIKREDGTFPVSRTRAGAVRWLTKWQTEFDKTFSLVTGKQRAAEQHLTLPALLRVFAARLYEEGKAAERGVEDWLNVGRFDKESENVLGGEMQTMPEHFARDGQDAQNFLRFLDDMFPAVEEHGEDHGGFREGGAHLPSVLEQQVIFWLQSSEEGAQPGASGAAGETALRAPVGPPAPNSWVTANQKRIDSWIANVEYDRFVSAMASGVWQPYVDEVSKPWIAGVRDLILKTSEMSSEEYNEGWLEADPIALFAMRCRHPEDLRPLLSLVILKGSDWCKGKLIRYILLRLTKDYSGVDERILGQELDELQRVKFISAIQDLENVWQKRLDVIRSLTQKFIDIFRAFAGDDGSASGEMSLLRNHGFGITLWKSRHHAVKIFWHVQTVQTSLLTFSLLQEHFRRTGSSGNEDKSVDLTQRVHPDYALLARGSDYALRMILLTRGIVWARSDSSANKGGQLTFPIGTGPEFMSTHIAKSLSDLLDDNEVCAEHAGVAIAGLGRAASAATGPCVDVDAPRPPWNSATPGECQRSLENSLGHSTCLRAAAVALRAFSTLWKHGSEDPGVMGLVRPSKFARYLLHFLMQVGERLPMSLWPLLAAVDGSQKSGKLAEPSSSRTSSSPLPYPAENLAQRLLRSHSRNPYRGIAERSKFYGTLRTEDGDERPAAKTLTLPLPALYEDGVFEPMRASYDGMGAIESFAREAALDQLQWESLRIWVEKMSSLEPEPLRKDNSSTVVQAMISEVRGAISMAARALPQTTKVFESSMKIAQSLAKLRTVIIAGAGEGEMMSGEMSSSGFWASSLLFPKSCRDDPTEEMSVVRNNGYSLT